EGVLLADVVAAHERHLAALGGVHRGPGAVAELRLGSGDLPPRVAQGRDRGVPPDGAQTHDRAHVRGAQGEVGVEPWGAGALLLRGRLVLRWGAPDGGDDPRAVELEPVAGCPRLRLAGVAGAVQRPVE